ncbi:MAG: energy-coupling factor transporter ATPase [Clostridia bacterium]|nr:energy-coupling factor transporter ATPase [Clostridia bacterium]
MSEYAISFRDVSYVYGEGTPFFKRALDHVIFDIKEGIITGIIGHTGSGKSTLLQMMNGLLSPHKGQVLVKGNAIGSKALSKRDAAFQVGLVFQYPEYQLFEETVFKDIAYGPKNKGLGEDEIKERVKEAIRFVGLGEDVLEKSPFELSGGQKRRVAIAGVLAMRPEILVLDEPAAGLDPRGRTEIFGNIYNYQKRTGTTVIIVSHSMEDMARYAEELAVMSDGKLMMHDTVRKVFSKRDLLESIGLDVPGITPVIERLRALGMPIKEDIFTVEEAREELLRLLKGGSTHA